MDIYRPDIDGLRAICILSVVMFHAGFQDWSGGFVGVDIFFVISGFLITSLIDRQISLGQFTLSSFYERRVRRLLAATIPVVVFATLFAAAFYTRENFVTYCKGLVAFVLYSSNWFFLSQTGYFAAAAETTPLLHTWSLGVEEQFYLVFPTLLLVLLRFPRSRAMWVIAVLALLSLAYAQLEISRGLTDRAFFGSVSRAWELLAGALLALAPAVIAGTARFALPMRVVGFAMIAASVFLYRSDTPFPGLAGLLPVGGALLLIAACPDSRDPTWRLLTASPMVYLGKISYSLYLWHWPVLGAVRTLSFELNDAHIVMAVGISIGLAALSHHFVEQPVRARRRLPRGRDMGLLLATTSVLGLAIGSAGWHMGTWSTAFASQADAVAARATDHKEIPGECFETQTIAHAGTFCRFGKTAQHKIDLLLWGDSHSFVLLPAFRKYVESRNLSLAYAGRGGCPPLVDTGRSRRTRNAVAARLCPEFNAAVRTFIQDHDIPVVVVTAWWSLYANNLHGGLVNLKAESGREAGGDSTFEDALGRTLRALQGRAVVVIEQVPVYKTDLPNAYVVLARLGRSIETLGADPTKHRRQQRSTADALDKAESTGRMLRIDPASALCDPDRCRLTAGGNLLYSDSNHLSVDGSLFLYPLIERKLDGFLALLPQREPD
jgi:peptidoglycan/LPS O-acetylase OafA/YrhL